MLKSITWSRSISVNQVREFGSLQDLKDIHTASHVFKVVTLIEIGNAFSGADLARCYRGVLTLP